MNTPIMCNDWYNQDVSVIFADFRINAPEGIEILIASYGYKNYTGEAFILFRKGGKLYEVNGSHCSCYGLEGQWEPEETTVEALKLRDSHKGDVDWGGSYCDNVFTKQMRALLETL